MKKGNQEQLCVKLDDWVFRQLSFEAEITGKPKNRIINDGVLLYATMARLRRDYYLGKITEKDLLGWIKIYLVETITVEKKK